MLDFKSLLKKLVTFLLYFLSTSYSQTGYWQATNGPDTNPIRSLIITNNGTLIAGGLGLFRSTNGGNIWTSINGDIAAQWILDIAQHPTGKLFALCYASEADTESIYMSTDDGIQWIEIQTGFQHLYANSLAISQSGTILLGGADTLYRSTDGGFIWTLHPQETIFYGSINTIIFDSSDVAYAGSVYGVCYSMDDGESWNVLGSGRLEYFISSLVITNTNEIIAGTYNHGIFKLNGYLSFWAPIGLTGKSSLTMITSKQGDVFLGRPTGEVLKYYGDTNWVSLGTGIPSTYVWSLALDSLGFLYAGTENGTVYRSNTKVTDVVNNPPNDLKHFYLKQNYPNPFNPSTNFSFQIASRTFVSLKVFDLMGREISTIVSEELSPGYYSYQWIASMLPSGVYFYRLQSDLFTETKKLLLLK